MSEKHIKKMLKEMRQRDPVEGLVSWAIREFGRVTADAEQYAREADVLAQRGEIPAEDAERMRRRADAIAHHWADAQREIAETNAQDEADVAALRAIWNGK